MKRAAHGRWGKKLEDGKILKFPKKKKEFCGLHGEKQEKH